MHVEDYLLLMKTIPIKHRGIVREHKLYKIYLPIDMNDLWRELHSRNIRFDVIVLIPKIEEEDKPELLKIINKIVMRKRIITREYKRFKIYLASAYNGLWKYFNERGIKVDVVLILR